EIEATRPLGEPCADAQEEERRAHANGARQHGKRHTPQAEAGVVHQPSLALNNLKRPYSVSLARMATKMMPCSTTTAASGRSSRRCRRPPEAPMPPSRIATGMMASG